MNAIDRQTLLALARQSIVAQVNGMSQPVLAQPTAALQVTAGCFVTIKQQGQLRGCIGSFVAQRPLWQTVQEMAISAATRDPRFQPMRPSELKSFSIEISVLSPLQPIQSIEDIQVGTHGIYLIKGHAHGVLLPQVAVEYGWDRETFLRNTCRKAGLPDNAWQQDCALYIFSAEVFGAESSKEV